MTEENRLDKKIRELSGKAQREYNDDPVAAILEHLYDVKSDLELAQDPEFIAGYKQAIYAVESTYIAHSRLFECDCTYPSPEKYNSDEWGCARCGETLVPEDEHIV